jgi:Fe-S-cluster containining protein
MTTVRSAGRKWDEIEIHLKRSLERMLQEIHSPASFQEVWPIFQAEPSFRQAFGQWAGWSEDRRENHWLVLSRALERKAYATRPYCLRCGECCRKGSPTFYREDLEIVRRGVVQREQLIALRPGEVGFSHEAQGLVVLAEERLKIREKPDSRECLFFLSASGDCTIYDHRPLQCRNLECWNPEGFEKLTPRVFLKRKDLINPDDPLLAVMESHDTKCSPENLKKALRKISEGGPSNQEEALDMLSFDRQIRQLLEEKYGLSPDQLTFLFGRPLPDLLPALGYRMEKGPEAGLGIVSSSPI